MPVGVIIALVNGVIAGAPAAISAFNSIKELAAGGKDTITAAELQQLLDVAEAAHNQVQGD